MLTKKQLKIVGFMSKNISEELSFSELKRKLNEKSSSSLQKILKEFSQKNLVTSRRLGTSKLYKLNLENDILFDCIAIHNKNNLSEKVKISLDFVKNALNKKLFYSLIVFGSYAEHKPKFSSDLDIAIIIPSCEQKKEFEACLNSASNKSLLDLDYHVFSKSEFQELLLQEHHNLAKEIKTKNLPIFGTEIFYKINQKNLPKVFNPDLKDGV
jgi:predicted nucleotidyltransferase